ncbi:MAG: GNAT family N-acetyltransferase [Eubacteriales bacterium]|nr:GNAT family N-acetyltransferase [Eubacteriales bacterium]MDD4511833.1 GNAT family N-acetyltransferase [Eubacteriales bacterium]
MDIRFLTGADKEAQEKLYSLSYIYPYFPQETPMGPDVTLDGTLGAFENGELAATVITHDFTCNFNGLRVKMGGVGGVACRPESKCKGYARVLLEKSLTAMYENGFVFSSLYPFSHEFYRNFGYEFAFSRRRCFITRETLADFRVKGSFVAMNDENEHYAREVYDKFSASLDYSLVRGDKLWGNFKPKKYSPMDYWYLYFSESGEPEGYIIAQNVQKDGNTFSVKDFAYLTPCALRSILGFIGSFNNHNNVVFDESGRMDMLMLLDEPYNVKLEAAKSGMLRVVNVMKALSLLKAPCFDGSVVIGTLDEQIPENSGSYEITAEKGKLTVKICEKAAEITFTMPALAAAFSGLSDFDTLVMSSSGITGDTGNPMLRALFPDRVTYLNDHF